MSLPPRSARIAVLLALGIALAAGTALVSNVFPYDRRWVQVPLHSVAEAIGVLAAFLLARLVLLLPAPSAAVAGRRIWASGALLAIGVLDLLHASTATGNLFVWLHSMSLLLGGLLFALAWVPVSDTALARIVIPWTALSATLVLATLSFLHAEAIPTMYTEAGFTPTAAMVNLTGGFLFLFAAGRFLLSHSATGQSEDLMFAILTLLFGLSGLVFDYSHLWNADWWLWHLIRVTAYLLAAAYLLHAFRQAQVMLERKSEELQRMNAELEEFAYVASHDLKSPLRGIANLALVIDEDAAAGLDDENRGRLRLLRERVKGMDALIENLLDYARLGQAPQRRVAVHLAPFIQTLISELPIPPGFTVDATGALPKVSADPQQLRQIFQNLITNATAHHDRERGHVWIRAREAGSHWRFEVADDGPGIAGQDRSRIFRMFTSGGSASHAGIGLAVVRKLVLANGGQIGVADNQPRGAVFVFTWPKQPPCEVS